MTSCGPPASAPVPQRSGDRALADQPASVLRWASRVSAAHKPG